MSRRRPLFLLGAVLAALVAGLVLLYRLRMGQGDVFPVYSSLRADPVGLRGLHDSLALPGFRVTRWLQPLDQLKAAPARTLIMAGVTPAQWGHLTTAEFNALDAAVRGGCRLVITLKAPVRPAEPDAAEKPAVAPPPKKAADPGEKKPAPGPHQRRIADGDEPGPAARQIWADLAKLWGIELRHRPYQGYAHRAPLLPPELPEKLPWNSDVYFHPQPGLDWAPLYLGRDPVLLERPEGLGSIVVAGDSYFLSNEALQRDRAVTLLVRVVGQRSRVEFIESHLGVTENAGIGTLARRYGLAPAFFTFLLLAALYAWRCMAWFAPPAAAAEALVLDYNQTAGLEALLRRALPPAELAAVCLAEWRTMAGAADLKRAEAALSALPPHPPAVETYNAVARALRRREKPFPT